VIVRLLSYNVRYGGVGREQPLAATIRSCEPDLVIFQEATRPEVIEQLARACGMDTWGSRRGHSLGFMSRMPLAEHQWHQPRGSRHAFLELAPAGTNCRFFGVHLSAVHAAWTERRRVRELRALLAAIRHHQHGFHVLAGDFNTLAPGELLDVRQLPFRLRPFVWLSGGDIRWRTIHEVLAAGYSDAYRTIHPIGPGYTFPTWRPHVRLDYVFLPALHISRLRTCRVVMEPSTAQASDHFPLLAELVAD
jgi:endonuclease/exonuclease/phosphatase family metal-dependent hydrolase